MAETIKLSNKDTVTTITDNDYITIVTSAGNVRRLQASVLKEYIESDILGGSS